MFKKITAWVFPMILLVSSCLNPDMKEAMITGNLRDVGGQKLTLLEMGIREIIPLDSVVPGRNGTFRFNLPLQEPGFWLIKAQTGKILVVLLNPGDQVVLSGSAHDFPDNVTLQGPPDAILLNDFFRFTRVNEHMVDSLEMLLVERQDSSDFYKLSQQLDTSFKTIWERQRLYEMAFIDKYPGSMASLIVLNYAFGLNSVLSPEEDYAYFVKLDSTLMKVFPENNHVKLHHQRVLDIKRNARQQK